MVNFHVVVSDILFLCVNSHLDFSQLITYSIKLVHSLKIVCTSSVFEYAYLFLSFRISAACVRSAIDSIV